VFHPVRRRPATASPARPRLPLVVLAAASLVSPPAARDADGAGCRDRTPTSWDIEIAPRSEPGERLILTGRVITREERRPLAGVTVYVYHADHRGRYNVQGREDEEPRLCGVLRTNERGEYRLRTVMPGGYSGAPPHVHFEAWGPKLPRLATFVNLIAAPREARLLDTTRVPGGRERNLRAARSDRSAMERPVVRGADGVLRASRDLVMDVP
jgi:protocatechuate 3,4-dioxygenase beta subunit